MLSNDKQQVPMKPQLVLGRPNVRGTKALRALAKKLLSRLKATQNHDASQRPK